MYRNILLPVDLNEESSWKKALPTAVDIAKASGAALHVITVVPDFGMSVVKGFFPDDFKDKTVDDAGERLAAFCAEHVPKGLDVTHGAEYGGVYEEVLRVADERGVDLIVLASHRPELSDYLLGPNAARVVRHAGCSVLVVRE
ncbi:MAG: universal stress protein [Rhodospirillales bacterium]